MLNLTMHSSLSTTATLGQNCLTMVAGAWVVDGGEGGVHKMRIPTLGSEKYL